MREQSAFIQISLKGVGQRGLGNDCEVEKCEIEECCLCGDSIIPPPP